MRSLADTLGRMQSGGEISKKEYVRVQHQVRNNRENLVEVLCHKPLAPTDDYLELEMLLVLNQKKNLNEATTNIYAGFVTDKNSILAKDVLLRATSEYPSRNRLSIELLKMGADCIPAFKKIVNSNQELADYIIDNYPERLLEIKEILLEKPNITPSYLERVNILLEQHVLQQNTPTHNTPTRNFKI